MPSYKQLNMATVLVDHEDIIVSKKFFGIITQLVYRPTGSKIRARQVYYGPESLTALKVIVESEPKALRSKLDTFGSQQQAIGNVMLEACVSSDGNFAALQVMQFAGYVYRATTDIRFFTEEDARLIIKALSL